MLPFIPNLNENDIGDGIMTQTRDMAKSQLLKGCPNCEYSCLVISVSFTTFNICKDLHELS